MKRFFISVLFVIGSVLALSAQTFEFRMNGVPVADGATVEFEAMQDLMRPGWVCMTASRLTVANLTDKDLSCTAQLSVSDNNMNATGMLICMTPQCYSFTNILSFQFTLEANGNMGTMYDAYPQKDGTMQTNMTVTCGSERHSVNILFRKGGDAGIAGTDMSDVCEMSITGVYNMAGSLVRQSSDANELSTLPHGVYIVRGKDIVGNVSSRKVVVR